MASKRIALTGSIATGKSTVAKRFRELGAIVLDADIYARRAVEPGQPSYVALRDLIGPDFFDSKGRLLRAELRRLIIGEPDVRQKINAVLHPFIGEAMRSDWERLRTNRPEAVVIFDIPLLFETNTDRSYDIIILVYCTPEIQLERLVKRDGISLSEAKSTVSMQFPIDSKMARSDYIIENSGDLPYTLSQVDEVWEKIRHTPV